jgi:arginase
MINLLGIPYDHNSSFLLGSAQAPRQIIKMHYTGSANSYCERGFEIEFDKNIKDLGDIQVGIETGIDAHLLIKNKVSSCIENGQKLISLGGDHAIAYPTISAHAQKYGPINILQIDAHGDLYENFENNPFSHASPFARLFEEGAIASLTQVGIRSLNPHQREQIKKYKVNTIEMKDFNLHFLEQLNSPIYISLDLDGLDPAFAPGVSHHEPGGLSTRDMLNIIHQLKCDIIGAEIVEYNPRQDIHNMTAMLAYKLVKEIASKMMYS